MTVWKSFAAQVKALPSENGGPPGQFEALVSAFGNVDLQGDRVLPTAFDKSIADWQAKGDPIPIAFSHDWSPWGIIGSAEPGDIEATPEGLKVKGSFDVETNPTAAQAYSLVKRRLVKEWSFAYDVVKEKKAADGANDLAELDLIEAGPTLKGANSLTETLSVKAAVALRDAVDRVGVRESAQIPSAVERGWLAALESVAAGHPVYEAAEKAQTVLETELSQKDESKQEPAPTSEDGLRAHLVAAEPDGHSMPTDEADAMGLDQLEEYHAEKHAAGAGHVHTAAESDGGEKAVDRGAWDGAAAMRSASSAADYRRIAFERDNDSDADTAAHWALPHHSSPGAPPNAQGVASALGALNGARGGAPDLKSTETARSHLEAHQRAIQAAASDDGDAKHVYGVAFDAKAGRVLSAKNESSIRDAAASIQKGLSDLENVLAAIQETPIETGKAEEPVTAKAEDPPRDEDLLRFQAMIAELAEPV